MNTRYASGRQQLPFSASNRTVNSGAGSLGVAGTYYLSIQGRNLVGLNLNSSLVATTVAATDNVDLTFPTLLAGEYWKYVTISASLTNDATTLTQICRVKQSDLLAGLTLDGSEILKLSFAERSVANPAALPTTGLYNGLIRYVTSLGYYYEYDPESTVAADGVAILTATTGRWLRIGTPNTYINATDESGGCDVDVRSPTLDVDAPTYAVDGSKGEGVTYWIVNDGTATVPAGTRVSAIVRLFSEDRSELFDSLLILESPGSIDLATLAVDSSNAVGETLFSPFTTNVTLPNNLPANSAFAVTVSPKFRPEHLGNNVPYLGELSVYLTFAAVTGLYVGGSTALGNLIYNELNLFRIVPTLNLAVIKLSGSGLILNYEIFNSPDQLVAGLLPNTASQYIYLTSNATSFDSTDNPITGAVVRAVVDTTDGIGEAISYGSVSLDNTTQLEITVNYPTAIRGNYPDLEIAGLAEGDFNAEELVVWIKDSGNNYFNTTLSIAPAISSEVFQLTNTDFIATTAPTTPPVNFGLYDPVSVVPVSVTAASGFATDTYEVFVAFKYSDTVTAIDHTVSEFILATTSLGELFCSVQSWGCSVATFTQLRAIPESERYNYQTRFIVEGLKPYRFEPTETGADNGGTIIKPTDLGANPGAWVAIDSSRWFTGSGVPSTSLGGIGDYYLDLGNGDLYAKTGVTTWTLLSNIYSENAFTVTTAGFTMPAIAANVTIDVESSTWAGIGQVVFVETAGYFEVVSKPSATQLQLENLGYTGNAVATTSISTAQQVSPAGVAGTSSGETNTASNQGVGGVGVFKQKTGVDLEFKNINSGDGISVTDDIANDEIDIALDINSLTTEASPDGAADFVAIYDDSASAPRKVLLNNLPTAGGGEANTASNVGTGNGVFKQKTGVNLEFKTIIAGSNIAVTNNVNDLTIATTNNIVFPSIAIPTTAAGETRLFVDTADNLLKYREASNGTTNRLAVLGKAQQYTATQGVNAVALTDGATTTANGLLSNVFTWSPLGNNQLTMTNIQQSSYLFIITQDTTPRVPTYDTMFKFSGGTPPTLTATSGAVDIVSCISPDGVNLYCSVEQNF